MLRKFGVRRQASLPKRQTQIARLIAEGLSNREIGARTRLSEGTVKLHVSRILRRLGARNRTEIARLALLG